MKDGCEIILSIIDFRETCCHYGGRSYRTWNFWVRAVQSLGEILCCNGFCGMLESLHFLSLFSISKVDYSSCQRNNHSTK